MAIPGTITTVKITAQYLDWLGNPQAGTVTFTPSDVGRLTGTLLIAQDIECNLDDEGNLIGPDGNIGVSLPATDDSDLAPLDLTYTVTEDFESGWSRTWALEVPTASGPTLDLGSIDPDAALEDNEEGVTT